MTEHIVGMFWNKNEGDIIEDTLTDAISKVDSLFVADDGSTDRSWDIIQSIARANPGKLEHIQQVPNKNDPAQRNALLNKIRERYRAEDTWVQIIESDIFILDTDIRTAIKERSTDDVMVTWTALNGVRDPGTWAGVDTYPVWKEDIRTILNKAHFMEQMHYTFRPFPGLIYGGDWRPWPRGMGAYQTKSLETSPKPENTPLLFHVGYRGPTHFYQKWKKTTMGDFHSKYKSWDLRSQESVEKTVSFFNGEWNGDSFVPSREGWIKRKVYDDTRP